MLAGAPASHVRMALCILAALLHVQLPNACGTASADPSICVHATHDGDQIRGPDSWLQAGPALSIAVIYRS